MSQSKNTKHVFGAIDVLNYTDLNNTRMTGLASPILNTDAVNKQYVDNKVVGSNLTGGVGITVNTVNNTINSNPTQTQLIALGTIQTGTWTANTIQIPYGGTGQTVFTVNKLIYHNSANKLASIPEFTYDSSTFNSTLPFVMSNTTDTTNTLSSVGSLIVQGGINISKRLYIGGDAMFNANVTLGNLTINGNLALNSINANSSQFTGSTTVSLLTAVASVTEYLTSNSTNSVNLRSTNNTFTNAIVSSNTVTNSLVTGTLNVPLIGIFGTINSSTISSGNVVGFSSYITNSSAANTTTTNLRSTNAIITNMNSTTNTMQNLTVSTLLNATNSILTNVTSTNNLLTNITNTNLNSSNTTMENIINTNISSSSGYINTISGGTAKFSSYISVPNITSSNIVSSNLSATNTVFTSTSIGNLRVAGTTNMTTLSLTTITTSNIYVNNLFTSTFNNQNSTTIGTLNVTGLSILSTTNSNSISTGTLYSNISKNTISSIGTLNVSGDINNSNGTIYSNNVTSNNLYASTLINGPNVLTTNITTSHLRSSGISIQGTVFSTNLSTGTINASSIINTLNLNLTNSTITNIQTNNVTITNATATNLRVTLCSVGNSYFVNSTTANAITVNANTTISTISNLLVTKNTTIVANYQGIPLTTAGSFFTIYPSTFINNATASGGSVNNWYANYIGASTLAAVNSSITTSRVANFYVKSNVIVGGNQTVIYNSAMTLGYVPNTTGGNMNTQLNFERSDGNPLGGIYTESATNRLVMLNGSLSGGAGIGVYTITDTPVVYSSIPSSTNIIPTPYIQLLNSTSTFYSTVDSDSVTSGALVLNGGLGVAKTITSNSVVTKNLSADNCTLGNVVTGSITQSGYGLFSLSTSSYPPGESDIEFNTSANFASGVSISIHPFTIGASIVLENVVTFQYSGVYSIHMRLNSSTTTTSATLLQTNLNKYVGNQWQVYQTSSQNTIFDNYTDFHSHFMIETQANEHWKFTFNNGYTSNFDFSIDSKKTRLMINKVG